MDRGDTIKHPVLLSHTCILYYSVLYILFFKKNDFNKLTTGDYQYPEKRGKLAIEGLEGDNFIVYFDFSHLWGGDPDLHSVSVGTARDTNILSHGEWLMHVLNNLCAIRLSEDDLDLRNSVHAIPPHYSYIGEGVRSVAVCLYLESYTILRRKGLGWSGGSQANWPGGCRDNRGFRRDGSWGYHWRRGRLCASGNQQEYGYQE
jgi:hypothetical protein